MAEVHVVALLRPVDSSNTSKAHTIGPLGTWTRSIQGHSCPPRCNRIPGCRASVPASRPPLPHRPGKSPWNDSICRCPQRKGNSVSELCSGSRRRAHTQEHTTTPSPLRREVPIRGSRRRVQPPPRPQNLIPSQIECSMSPSRSIHSSAPRRGQYALDLAAASGGQPPRTPEAPTSTSSKGANVNIICTYVTYSGGIILKVVPVILRSWK